MAVEWIGMHGMMLIPMLVLSNVETKPNSGTLGYVPIRSHKKFPSIWFGRLGARNFPIHKGRHCASVAPKNNHVNTFSSQFLV